MVGEWWWSEDSYIDEIDALRRDEAWIDAWAERIMDAESRLLELMAEEAN